MIRKRGVFLGEGPAARLFRIDASLFFHYIGTTTVVGGENNNFKRVRIVYSCNEALSGHVLCIPSVIEAVECSYILSSMRTIQTLETNSNIIGGT